MEQSKLVQKFLDKYNILEKEHGELQKKYDKIQKEHTQQVQKEKDSKKAIQEENNRLQKTIKDLRTQFQTKNQQILNQENQAKDLIRRLNYKQNLDEKSKERDTQIFQKFLGRKPVSTNSQDLKLVTIINTYEGQKDRLQRLNDEFSKDNEKLRFDLGKLRNFTDQNQNQQEQAYSGLAEQKEELMVQIQYLEKENFNLKKDNQKFIQDNEELVADNRNLDTELTQFKRLYDKTQSQYLNQMKTEDIIQQNNLPFQQPQQQQRNNILQNQQQQQYQFNSEVDYEEDFEKRLSLDPRGKFQNQREEQKKQKQVQSQQEEILGQLKGLFKVQSDQELISCGLKTQQVMQAIPRLESLIKQICQIVLFNEELENHQGQVDMLIPTIQLWRNEVTECRTMRQKLTNFQNSVKEQQIDISDFDIDVMVQEFQNVLIKNQQLQSRILEIQNISSIKNLKQIENIQNILRLDSNDSELIGQKIEEMVEQLGDIQKFIQLCRQLLDLDPQTNPAQNVLTYIIRLIEKMKMSQYNDPDLIMKLQKLLRVDTPALLLPKIQSLIEKK